MISADGIALGAATSVSQTGLTIIVFIAIMLHKVSVCMSLTFYISALNTTKVLGDKQHQNFMCR